MKKFLTLLLLLLSTAIVHAQLNVSYISDLAYNNDLNDVWGYAAPDGTEYALVGVANGTSIVSLADPANPVEVAFIAGDNTTWRDIKTWENFAFVTCDDCSDGLVVIDLSDLPNSVTSSAITSVPNGTLGSCHNIYIDEFGYAYLAGCTNLSSDGNIIMDVFTDPANPAYVTTGPDVYSHDVYARGNKLYASEINDGHFTIYDVEDKTNITNLGSQTTPFAFTHNAWLSDDGNTLFTTDELANAPVGSYDVSDPTDIQFLDSYAPFATLGDGVIPHNVHVWQNWLIVSYYTDGCIILDSTHPDNLIEVGNFDTFIPPSTGFQGVWGAYPFLPSGLILCTDIGNGLFVLEPNYVQAAYLEGTVSDASTGAAIAQANVSLLTTITFEETNALGIFKTGIATAGSYEVEVSKPGYEPATVSVNLVNGEIATIDVELTPLPSFAFTGNVVEAGTNTPVPNAMVNISNQFFNFDLTSDADGNFSIPAMFEDEYDVYAGLWTYKTNILETQTLDFSNNTITIELEKGLEDIFSIDMGWAVSGNGGFFQGNWERGNPIGLFSGGLLLSPEDDVMEDLGNSCYVTGNSSDIPGSLLIGGTTILTSPVFDLTGYNVPMLNYHYWYLNAFSGNQPLPANDPLIVRLNNGTETVIIADYTMADTFNLAWQNSTDIKIDSLIEPTSTMTFSITALATGNAATETSFDYWRVWDAEPTPPVATHDLIDPSIRITVQPNPSIHDFQMTYDLNDWSGTADLLVSNVLGQNVEMIPLSNSADVVRFGNALPQGIYFVRIQEEGRSSRVVKLIKE